MQDFLYSLYDMENFTTVIIIAIVVLTVLFILILMLGKKDQKLEETKKLEKLAMQGFKDESSKKLGEVKSRENIDILLPPQPKLEKKEEKLKLELKTEEKEDNLKSNDLIITEFEKNDPESILESYKDKINISEENSFSSLDKTMVDIDNSNFALNKSDLDLPKNEPLLVEEPKTKLRDKVMESKKIKEVKEEAPLLSESSQMLEDTIIFPAITEDLMKQTLVEPAKEKEIDLFKLTTDAETLMQTVPTSYEPTIEKDVFADFDATHKETVEVKKVELPNKPATAFNYDDLLNDLDLNIPEDKGSKKPVFSSVYSPSTDVPEELNVTSAPLNANIDKTMQMPRLKSDMIANNEEFTFNSILGETYNV